MHRLWLAIRCFFAVLLRRRLPSEVLSAQVLPAPAPAAQELPAPAPTAIVEATPSTGDGHPSPSQPAVQPPPVEGAVHMLALLQREGRLIDFLLEPVDEYSDAQIGAAVRDIHRNCRKVLDEHFAIEPIMPGSEEAPVEVTTGFDATAIRLVGNVTGQPPYRGVLRHHGWRAARASMPNLGDLTSPAVLAPAEVELS